MTNKTIIYYYATLGAILVTQTIATVISGSHVVLNSSALAELKKERQNLLQMQQMHQNELLKHTALSALPSDATNAFIPISKPIVLSNSTNVASTQP